MNKFTLQHNVTEGAIWKHMLRIATPVMLGQLFYSLYNWIDIFWAGKISTQALAALSLAFPVFLISIAISQCIFSGSMVLISNALGKQDKTSAQNHLEQSIGLSCVVGIITMTLVWIISPFVLRLLGGMGTVLNLAINYISILVVGMPFLVFTFACNAGLLSRGNTTFMRNVYIMNVIINLVLDPLFMYGIRVGNITAIPAMGVRGIALATALVQALGAILALCKIIKEKDIRTDTLRRFFVSGRETGRIIYYGLPIFCNIALASLGFAVVNFFLLRLGGGTAVAAYVIGLRVEQLALIPSMGIGTALSSVVGQNNGAGKFDRVAATYKSAALFALALLVGGMLPITLFGKFIAGIFTDDVHVRYITAHYLWFSLSVFYAYQLMFASSSTLQGMKHPIFPMIMVIIRQLILPWIFIFLFAYAMSWGIYGVFASTVTCAWLTAVIMVIFVCTVLKKKRANIQPSAH